MSRFAINTFRSVSIAELIGAALCFCLSLTPSLMPRSNFCAGGAGGRRRFYAADGRMAEFHPSGNGP